MTALRVGLKDSVGTVTRDPTTFCPKTDLVVEAKITNRGCAASPTTTTVVTLEYPSFGTGALATSTIATPSIAPGATWTTTANFKMPASSFGGSTEPLAVHACADAKLAIPDQCDRNSLCALLTKPLASGASPKLSLAIGGRGFVVPGEIPTFFWSMQNDCADIG